MNDRIDDDDLGARLTQELHRRADVLSDVPADAPLAFRDVRGRATTIRRRRTLATGLGVAAAIAVILPTAIFAGRGLDRGQEPPPASQSATESATDGASPSPTSTPVMGPRPHALDVRDLPTGAPPAVPLVTGSDSAMAQTGEAHVRWTSDGIVVEAGGRTFGPYPSSHGLVRNDAATAVAWTTDDGDVMVWADGAGEPFTLASLGAADVRIGALTGTDCRRDPASDCTYYVSRWPTGSDQPEAVAINGDGVTGNVDPDRTILSVRDATDSGRVLGLTEVRDDGTCSAVLDPADFGSDPLLATCAHAFDAFSPDGSYVLASDTYGDGIGAGQIAVYATAGDILAKRSRTDDASAFYNSAVWEDETHVLFTAYQDGRWSIVRMGIDGAMEYAVAPVPGDPLECPFVFETR
jgi:hypothetical protein